MVNTRFNYFGVEPNWCGSLALPLSLPLIENSSVYSHEKGYSFGDNYFINKRIRAWLNECRKPRWQTQNDLTKCQYITVKNGFCLNGINARWHNKCTQTSIDRYRSINLSHTLTHLRPETKGKVLHWVQKKTLIFEFRLWKRKSSPYVRNSIRFKI